MRVPAMVPKCGKLHIETITKLKNPMLPMGAFLNVLNKKSES